METSTTTIEEVIKAMPDYLAIKVRRVAKEKKITLAEAVIFLAQKGINAHNG